MHKTHREIVASLKRAGDDVICPSCGDQLNEAHIRALSTSTEDFIWCVTSNSDVYGMYLESGTDTRIDMIDKMDIDYIEEFDTFKISSIINYLIDHHNEEDRLIALQARVHEINCDDGDDTTLESLRVSIVEEKTKEPDYLGLSPCHDNQAKEIITDNLFAHIHIEHRGEYYLKEDYMLEDNYEILEAVKQYRRDRVRT